MKIRKPFVTWEEFIEGAIGGAGTPAAHTHIKADITDTPWVWGDVSKAGSNLTDLATWEHAAQHEVGGGDLIAFADITDFGDWLDQAVKQASNVQFAGGYFTGDVGFGVAAPDALAHVYESGGLGLAYDADIIFIVQKSGAGDSVGMALIANAAKQAFIYFGDEADTDIGRIVYENDNDAMVFFTNNLERIRIDSAGQVGIGTADIEAWNPSYHAIEFPASAIMFNAINPWIGILSNAYFDGAWKYKVSDFASNYYQVSGEHFWNIAASGVANNAIAWTTAMQIDNAGQVGIGKVPTVKLDVNGTIKATQFYLNLGGLLDVNLGSLEQGETIMYDQGSGEWIDAWGVEYDNPRLVWKMYTDFFTPDDDTNDPWLGASLLSGTLNARPGEEDHPGIIRLSSVATEDSGYRFMTALNCIRLNGGESAEFVFRTGISLADVRIRLGFQDSNNYTAPTDGMYIDINGTTLKGITRNNGAETVTGTTYVISTVTWYRVKIALSTDKATATFWLYSEAGNQLWSNTTGANIPTAVDRELGHGFVTWITSASGRILMHLDMMVASQAGVITR